MSFFCPSALFCSRSLCKNAGAFPCPGASAFLSLLQDAVKDLFAFDVTVQVLTGHGDSPVEIEGAVRRAVGRDDDVFHIPKGAVGGQGLLFQGVQRGAADDAAPNTADKPATKPKRAPKRRSKKRPKPGLLDGIDTSDLSADERELVRRRAAIKKSMKGNKRANTKPELLVRQCLRAAGLTGYRLEWKVPGKPDIAFPGRKIAIFVNGCFWHRCPKCNPSQPKRNVEFWEAKFRRNVERDRAAVTALTQMGWTPITIWECELKKDRIDATMEKVIEQVRAAEPLR